MDRLGEGAGHDDVGDVDPGGSRLRRVENLLAESQALAHIGSWEHDFATRTSWWSPEQYRLLGLDPATTEAAFATFIERVHPDDRAGLIAARERAEHGGKSYEVVCRVIRPDGVTRFVHARGRVISDADGATVRLNGTTQDVTDREQTRIALEESRAALTHQALHDRLTGLPNRALIEDRLTHALDLQQRTGGLVGVLFVDIDRFKLTNDGLGHSVGDELLVAVGARLRDAVRAGDTVARMGGDEFVVVCEGLTNDADAETAASRIVDAFARPLECASRRLSISVSVGVALAAPGEHDAAQTLIRDADTAMYRAKDAGRNRYAFFDERSRELSQARLELEQDLRNAARSGELYFDYQPQFAIGDRSLVGAEALIRWQHPTRGRLSPGEFVPLAEESGLIETIGAWGVREASRCATAWAHYPCAPQVVVNIAARQLLAPGFDELVASAVESAGLRRGQLCLELTESSPLPDPEQAIERLAEVRAIGIDISLDDFGTGYSSLGHFSRLPIDWVKVDQSFVARLGHDAPARAVVESVIRIAATRDIKVVAEGVETEAQLELLGDLGCGFAQGFLLARPMPAEELEARFLA